MSDLNGRETPVGTKLVLLLCLLGLCLVFPTAANAGGPTIFVAPPNGKDDTANIQAALNACVAKGPGCTVQLAAGTYFTSQLVVYNFQGTFKGKGMNATTIEALYPLPVKSDRLMGNSNCAPNTTTCLWSSLIIFVEGNIHVSDMSIKENAPPGTATTGMYFSDGSFLTDLVDVFRFMGQYPTNVWLDRINIEGLPDNSSTSYGFNVVQCASYAGELPYDPAGDAYFLTGNYTVRNSYFKSALAAVEVDGFLRNNIVTVGGSPSTGNVIENVGYPIDTDAAENSRFEISYNRTEGLYASEDIMPWSTFAPKKPSWYYIHDNRFTTAAPWAEGVFILDDPAVHWIRSLVYNNTIGPQQYPVGDGIGVYNAQSTVVWDNTINGSGADAISLNNSTLSSLIRNNVADFTLDLTFGLFDQIYLDPATSYDLVVCAERSDTVLNQGANNTMIGCQQTQASPEAATVNAAPAVSVPRPPLPKGKPWLH